MPENLGGRDPWVERGGGGAKNRGVLGAGGGTGRGGANPERTTWVLRGRD